MYLPSIIIVDKEADMFYRVHQFYKAFFPCIKASEINWVHDKLSPQAYTLFLKQALPEQRHALDVAWALLNDKQAVSSPDFQNLVTAALLHDCGKSIVTVRLWHRVFVVLMQKFPHSIWSFLERGHSFLATPLQIASQHAFWGSSLAEEAGLNSDICRLIREHHSPQTDLGLLLEEADNTH
jgi:HD-like signal output (HDOD) protein